MRNSMMFSMTVSQLVLLAGEIDAVVLCPLSSAGLRGGGGGGGEQARGNDGGGEEVKQLYL